MTGGTRFAQRGVTVKFKRNDLAVLINALEAVIEEAKYDGGLMLVEEEMRLYERLRMRLRQHDLGPTKKAKPE